MAAPLFDDTDGQDGIFQQELELLQEIFIHEIKINKENGFPYELELTLHPATADRTDLQYVTLTIIFKIDKEYPDVLPDISIRNPRGLSEGEVLSLQKRLSECATERTGEAMLYELIVIAKESLTANNAPSCPCVICYHTFQESDEFNRTHCYHYFHSSCLTRYISYAQQNEEEALCPVCRKELQLDSSPADLAIAEDTDTPKFTPDPEMKAWQEEMAAHRSKQAQKGGIIDVTANSNKFLLDISSTPSIPFTTATSDFTKTASEGLGLIEDKKEDNAPISKVRDHHRGRGRHPREDQGHHPPGRRGDQGGARGGRGRGHDRGRSRRGGHHPRDDRYGSDGRTRSGGSSGRGSPPCSRRDRETENRGRGPKEGHRNERERGGNNRRQPKDPGEKEGIVEEEGGFNLYENEVVDRRRNSGKETLIDRMEREKVHNGSHNGNSRERQGRVERDKNDYGEREIGIREDTSVRHRRGRGGGVSKSGDSGGCRGVSGKEGEDELKQSRREVDGAATAEQKILVHKTEDGADDRDMAKEGKNGLEDGISGTDAKEVISDDQKSTSYGENETNTNVGDVKIHASMLPEKNTRIDGRPLQPKGEVRRAQTSGRQSREWRGRGRRNFGGQGRNPPDQQDRSIHQEGKPNTNKAQRSTQENDRAGGKVIAQGYKKDQRDGGTLQTQKNKEHPARGPRCVRTREQRNDLKKTYDRTRSSAVSEGKRESHVRGNDRAVHNSRRPPPGFDDKPRPPPGFENFR